MEHWLPRLHDKMETLFEYIEGAALQPQADDAAHERIGQINEYYEARRASVGAC